MQKVRVSYSLSREVVEEIRNRKGLAKTNVRRGSAQEGTGIG